MQTRLEQADSRTVLVDDGVGDGNAPFAMSKVPSQPAHRESAVPLQQDRWWWLLAKFARKAVMMADLRLLLLLLLQRAAVAVAAAAGRLANGQLCFRWEVRQQRWKQTTQRMMKAEVLDSNAAGKHERSDRKNALHSRALEHSKQVAPLAAVHERPTASVVPDAAWDTAHAAEAGDPVNVVVVAAAAVGIMDLEMGKVQGSHSSRQRRQHTRPLEPSSKCLAAPCAAVVAEAGPAADVGVAEDGADTVHGVEQAQQPSATDRWQPPLLP